MKISFENSYCKAKWLQVSIKLQNGVNHSCHHPPVHKIPLDGLNSNLNYFHNSPFKIQQRKKMLKGKRPSECSYCWAFEDKGFQSDRFLKSNSNWAQVEREGLYDLGEEIPPSYLEVSFSNTCNLACAYCNLENSSKIEAENKKFGSYLYEDSYRVSKRKRTQPGQKDYVELFQEWFPSISNELKVFRITGGEPLLSKNTFEVLKHYKNNPNPDLELSINSNLSLDRDKVKEMASAVEELIDSNSIKEFILYTSIDCGDRDAEFIRYGLDTNLFWSNFDYLYNLGKFKIVIMCTYGVYSVASFSELIDKLDTYDKTRVELSLNILRYPAYLSISSCDQEDAQIMRNDLKKLIESKFDERSLVTFNNMIREVEGSHSSGAILSKVALSLFIEKYISRKNLDVNRINDSLQRKINTYSSKKRPLLRGVVLIGSKVILMVKYIFRL